jgi:hypothetical protein
MKILIGLLAMAVLASAQMRTVGSGTNVTVRTSEKIDAKKSDGRVYAGSVEQDVTDGNGSVVLPRGSSAELVVRQGSNRELSLDLESVTVNGQRYAVTAEESQLSDSQKDSIGANKRTGEYVGGGAAIGAGVGAGAGAGTQVLTRGKAVKIPAESLLTFRLEQPLQMGATDQGFTRRGRHYHRNRSNGR